MAVDLNAIKTAFKSILDAANDTAAAYDLSTGMNTRVQRVLKVNPNKLPIDAALFPYCTIFPLTKSIDADTIAKDQLNAKRMTEITFQVVGAVWEPNTPDTDEDEADEQIEVLMENIEEVVRRNYRLNNTVLWSFPNTVEYHTAPIDEESHMRVGIMDLVCKVQY